MVVRFTTTYAIGATKVVTSNPDHGEVYSRKHYVRKFVNDFETGRRFTPGTEVSFTYKTDCHDITEILLRVVLNTINNTHSYHFWMYFNIILNRYYTKRESE